MKPRPVARTKASWRRLESSRGWRQKRRLGLGVFGVHSTLVLEPATMLKAALRPWDTRVQIFMRDCPRGNAAWSHHCSLQCQALGSCEPGSEGSSRLWVDLVHMFEEAIHERWRYYQVADYLSVLVEMHRLDPDLRAAEMYVCTAPLVCSLLRAVVEKPLLAYLGMQLHVNVDRQTDQLWLMHFQAMVRDQQSNVWAAHNFALREQIRYATGMQLEVVRPRALYVQRSSKLYGTSPGKEFRRQVLFFRSSYFRLSLFLPVLEAHVDACGSQLPLALRVVRSGDDFVPFRQMGRFRAAVLFPWDPALMAFYELYSLGPALLLPRSAWIYKIQHFSGWTTFQELGAVEFPHLPEGLRADPRPFWRPETSVPETVLHWYAYSDCSRLPHLLRFESFPELFRLLLDSQRLRSARRGMRHHNRRALQSGLRWYRDAALWLLAHAEKTRMQVCEV
ncbi:unnamed protein product [Symbiodinium necroappetens]|uniref:Uncharacterized protein n=1 Tax=Symbiodinium necroappetens TaxID=1628268 RepID=A0A812J8G7_9DINO|nr:unnamed protein product [Symbiodinium necroappetens]